MTEEKHAPNTGREDKNPWDKWFWQDYETDTGLRISSLAAQGLWMRMLSIMAKSKKKGALLDGESKMESKSLAKLVGEDQGVVDCLLAELKSHDVYSQTDDGVIFNRRMVREKELSLIRSECGKMGGRPKKQKGKKGKANESKVKAPSAYASASASASASEEEEVQEREDKFDEFWKAYPQAGRHAKKESGIRFGALVKRGELKEFIDGFHGYLDFLKHEKLNKGFDQTPMYAKTFLGDRWREFIGFEFKSG